MTTMVGIATIREVRERSSVDPTAIATPAPFVERTASANAFLMAAKVRRAAQARRARADQARAESAVPRTPTRAPRVRRVVRPSAVQDRPARRVLARPPERAARQERAA